MLPTKCHTSLPNPIAMMDTNITQISSKKTSVPTSSLKSVCGGRKTDTNIGSGKRLIHFQFLLLLPFIKIHPLRSFVIFYNMKLCVHCTVHHQSCPVLCCWMWIYEFNYNKAEAGEAGKLVQHLGHNLISRLQINLEYSQVSLIFNKLHNLQWMSETDQKLF